MELTNDQVYAVMSLESWWHSSDSKQVFEISGKSGSGKCQPMDTIIPTPDGKKLLGELKAGDYVYNRHGKPVKILSVHDQGKKRAYEVIFDDGRSTICSREHIWTHITSKGNLKSMTLEQMMFDGIVILNKHSRKHNKYRIPTNEAIEYE